MEITYTVIVYIITYIMGALNKLFFKEIPNKYIPIQNVIIGVLSGVACYYLGIYDNMLQSLVLCFMSAIGAGGTADLVKTIKGDEK